MKKRYALLIILVLFFTSTKTVKSSAEDIVIQKFEFYQEYHEVFVYFEGIHLPIGFHVWFNNVEITPDCTIQDESIFSDLKILVIRTPNEVGNHNVTISFYDHSFIKSFTVFIDYYGTTFNSKDLFTFLAIFVGILLLNIILSLFTFRRKTGLFSAEHMTSTDEERKSKWLIMMIASSVLLLYYSFNPFFYYPQVTNFTLSEFLKYFDSITLGLLAGAVLKFIYHFILSIIGFSRKSKNLGGSKKIGFLNYCFRSMVTGIEPDIDKISKKKRSSVFFIVTFPLLCIFTAAQRISVMLFLTAMYDYFPRNFMLVLDEVPANTLISSFKLPYEVFYSLFLICLIMGCLLFVFKFFPLLLSGKMKREGDKIDRRNVSLGIDSQQSYRGLESFSDNSKVNIKQDSIESDIDESQISQTENISGTERISSNQLDLVKSYIGELKGLKAIGREIKSDPRTFKKEITSLGIEVPYPGSIWTKFTQHLNGRFYKPVPKQLEEIIVGSLLGDAQIRLQSKSKEHRNNPTIQQYRLTLDKIEMIREKAKNRQQLNKTEILFWNYAVDLIKRTNTANFRIHKSIFELEWVKFLKDIFTKYIDLTTYVKPLNYPSSKWTCGFDTSSSIQMFELWKNWYIRKYNKNIKILPLITEITPNILLHWYVDDGYMSGSDISLSSQAFSLEENQKLVKLLREKNIECKIRFHHKKPFINISAKKDNKEVFFGFMEQAKYYEESKKFFLHKFTNSITKSEWRIELLQKHPEFNIKSNEARKTLESELI